MHKNMSSEKCTLLENSPSFFTIFSQIKLLNMVSSVAVNRSVRWGPLSYTYLDPDFHISYNPCSCNDVNIAWVCRPTESNASS